MMHLQQCQDCGAVQYPLREFCGVCLSDAPEWITADSLPGSVLARTLLYHSHEPRFRSRLPLWIGLVRFDAGPVAICFLARHAVPGAAVQVRMATDGLLEAA